MNKDKDLSQKILETIETQKIKPTPKWACLLKSYVVWTAFGVALVIGSLATSVIIFFIRNDQLSGYVEKATWLKKIAYSLPYFWLLIIVGFIFIAYYNFKYTEKGYRYKSYLIIVASIIISLILGTVVYAIGGAEEIEEIVYQKVPVYQKIMRQRGQIMINPQNGRLAGVIVSTPEGVKFELLDFADHVWIVQFSSEQAPPKPMLHQGMRIKMIGEKISDNTFQAIQIHPWFLNKKIIIPQPAPPERNKLNIRINNQWPQPIYY